MSEDRREVCDVVVVGGGIAGLTAAVRLAQGGKNVILCERQVEDDYVCNTRMTSGAIHCCQTDPDTDPAQLEEIIVKRTEGRSRPDLARAIADNASPFIQWLQSTGVPVTKGEDYPPFAYTIQPPALVPDGYAWKGRGGDQMMQRLEGELTRLGSVLLRGRDVETLLMDQGRVIGLEGTKAEGGRFRIRAGAVVLAGGGFEANPEMLRKQGITSPEKLFPRHSGAGIGTCLTMATAVGAADTKFGGFYGHVLSKDAFHNNKLWPFPYLDPILQGGIIVSADGTRFADEGQGGTAIANAIAHLADPANVTVIVDERIWNERGIDSPPPPYAPNPRLAEVGGSMIVADTLPELAKAAGLPEEALIAEVEAYNAAVRNKDAESLLPPRSSAKASPLPIEVGPFYAFPACAAISYTMDGISIDGRGSVLDVGEYPIPGLYAAGCATGGLEGGTPPAYVNGLLKSGVTGLIVAQTILDAA